MQAWLDNMSLADLDAIQDIREVIKKIDACSAKAKRGETISGRGTVSVV